MNSKAKLATAWLQGCSGCHIALLDLHQELLDVLKAVDIVYSPLVDIKDVPEADIGLLEGAIGNEENEHMALTFRKRSRVIAAFGTCACFGGISGLRNLFQLDEVVQRAYAPNESVTGGEIPHGGPVPQLHDWVKPVNQVITVDAYIPGCPPPPAVIKEVLLALVEHRKLRTSTRNLCAECTRKKTKMLLPTRDFVTDGVLSPHEVEVIDPEKCFLEQSVLCMGPATREGCGARCLKGNMPCRGCMGPLPSALEQGARIINAVASILPAGGLMFQEDMVGTGYRYSLPVSIFPHVTKNEGGHQR